MKRALAFSGLMALLVSCPQPQPPAVDLPDVTVDLGQQTSTRVTEPYAGTWRVTSVPLWLSVSSYLGSGDVALTITADRNGRTPLTADQSELTDQIKVEWTAPDGQTKGTAIWTVKAQQYELTGRVQDQAAVTAQDIQPQALSSVQTRDALPESRGIIVTYRSPAIRDAVLKDTGLQAQGLNTPAGQSAAKLQALGVGRQDRRALTRQSLVLGVPASSAALNTLRADPNVESAVPNRVLHALSTPMTGQALAAPLVPTDQYAPLQWAFQLLGYQAVWRDMEGGPYRKPVTVAVLDSGVRLDHPDLAGKLFGPSEGARDFVDNDTDPTDPGTADYTGNLASHGTHVTGIIAANWGQNTTATCAGCSPTGVVGATYLAPVNILPVRVLSKDGVDVATLTTALEYAAGNPVSFNDAALTNPHPAQVINLSLGGPGLTVAEAAPMCDALERLRRQGILSFAAAGNDGTTAPYYPAACPAAVAVASVTLSGGSAPVKAWYSNAYPKVELSAPGGAYNPAHLFNGGTLNGQPFPDDIISTGWDYRKNEPNYTTMSGTSQATPQATALAALLLSKGVTSTAEDTLQRMKDTATDLGAAGADERFGVGMINPAAALNAPDITDTLGLRLQDEQGRTFQPALNALGQFDAYLGSGTYRVVAGRDRNGNGIYGEVQEPRAERSVTLGAGQPSVNVGVLIPR